MKHAIHRGNFVCAALFAAQLFAAQLIVTQLVADPITIKNFTNQTLYGAVYYVEGRSNDGNPGDAQQASDIVTIPSYGTVNLERPERKIYGSGLSMRWYDRDLYIAQDKDTLTAGVQKGSLPFVNVGSTQGNEFMVTLLGDQIAAFSLKQSNYITVNNTTDKDLFGAIYYLEGSSTDQRIGQAFRFGDVVRIPAQSAQTILRPPQRCKFYLNNICSNYEDRDLYLSFNENDLQTVVPKGALTSINIGSTRGSIFYVHNENDILETHNYASWLARPASRSLTQVQQKILALLRAKFEEHDHQHKVATIRTSDTLAPEEQTYRAQRLPRIKQVLETLLDQKLEDNEVPVIALCGSGGGCRAMLSTLGSFVGAEQIGLFDTCMYTAGLSGSTWAIASLLQSGMRPESFIGTLAPRFATDISSHLGAQASKQIATNMIARLAYQQQLSIIDLYGGLLAEKFLKTPSIDNPQQLTLSDQARHVATGANPFPIYTALIAQNPYEWIEYTPYEIGSGTLRAFVPSWAFGREFKAGKSQNFEPALSLGFCMGTWGSAISVNAQEAIQVFAAGIPESFNIFGLTIPASFVGQSLAQSIKKVPQIGQQRAYPARIANWMQGVAGPYQHIQELTLVDAGLYFNLPTPPLLRQARDVSVIIILDASSNAMTADELRKAETFARQHGLKFPPIDYSKVHDICSVHSDPDPTVPTVIYLPLVANKAYLNGWEPLQQKFTGTFNFVYTPQEIGMLSGLTRTNMVMSKDMIISAIQENIEKRKAQK